MKLIKEIGSLPADGLLTNSYVLINILDIEAEGNLLNLSLSIYNYVITS